MQIVKEALPAAILLVIASAGAWLMSFIWGGRITFLIAIVTTLISAMIIFFFRDPERNPPDCPDTMILSPADGKVISIEETEEPEYLNSKVLKISIFLSLTNVHVNRIPFSGTVKFKKYRKGKFAAAFKEKASTANESMMIGLDCGNNFRLAVKQIAGFIARRIICRANLEQKFLRGERYGLICFGSRTEIFLPLNTIIKVKPGDNVKAGQTIIGEKL